MTTQNINLNSSHIVPGTNNSQMVFTFPQSQTFSDSSIAVHSIRLYHSWFNINNALYNNAKFQYKWWNNANPSVLVNYDVQIQDIYYTIESPF